MLTIDMVIDALKNNPVGHFPRQALEDAITQQAAITPMQLQYLAETAAAPLPPAVSNDVGRNALHLWQWPEIQKMLR